MHTGKLELLFSIGLEAIEQMTLADDQPDVIVGCTGGGSNFAGLVFPYIGYRLRGEGYENLRVVAVEPGAEDHVVVRSEAVAPQLG